VRESVVDKCKNLTRLYLLSTGGRGGRGFFDEAGLKLLADEADKAVDLLRCQTRLKSRHAVAAVGNLEREFLVRV